MVSNYRSLTVMRYRNNKTRSSRAMILVEILIAMTIMAIVFSAVIPQFRAIQNSWDSKQANSEILQNGRVLIDQLNRNLSKATRITAVSGPAEFNGYIEFMGNDANNLRFDINGTSNYVEFGPVGSLYDLAGPVSQLLFTCYDGNDFDVPITDVNFIRFIKVQTNLTNPSAMGQDKAFTTSVYLRACGCGDAEGITKFTPFEYDTLTGKTPALAQLDVTHYLCAYQGNLNDGWAVILTVDTDTGQITKETPFEFDTSNARTPALCRIDGTHYLCVYSGLGSDGWATVLTVNTGNWTISKEIPFEFDTTKGVMPALTQIDASHYLCAYQGNKDDGWAVVLTVNPADFSISKGTPFEFDTSNCDTPAMIQIDSTHYLCVYAGIFTRGMAVVLSVNPADWSISRGTPFEYDNPIGSSAVLEQIDTSHYLCAYHGFSEVGLAVVLTVNTGTWEITKETPFESDTIKGDSPALALVDPNNFLCTYTGELNDGWAVMLTVSTGTWEIAKGTPFEFDTDNGITPALEPVDPNNYLCVYDGTGTDGWSVILKPGYGSPLMP
ncbi:MAG: type II secretion system protein [Planctomycetes bacterium]|nr:type II secretion system protein [Planctomycetota bacterium]